MPLSHVTNLGSGVHLGRGINLGEQPLMTGGARAGRGVDRQAVMSLTPGDWIDSRHRVLITGPTGGAKS